jgi:hypothetical protein
MMRGHDLTPLQILIRRGKHGQKHYTVFLAEVPEDARERFEPSLSDEHSDWHWFKVSL